MHQSDTVGKTTMEYYKDGVFIFRVDDVLGTMDNIPKMEHFFLLFTHKKKQLTRLSFKFKH